MTMERNECNFFIENAKQFGLEINEQQAALFEKYKDMLIDWNERMNLTAITEPGEIFIKHFLDSIIVLRYHQFDADLKVLDIGTGAGFPGLPIKIMRPELKVTLLDSLTKRFNFLQTLIKELSIKDVEFLNGRAENFAKENSYREKFDIVVSRAVASLNVLAEYTLPYVRVGGVFIAYKGPQIGEEVNLAEKALTILGGRVKTIEKIDFGGDYGQRNLAIIEKISTTPAKYPRREGIPSKKPL